jgi:hypothetical protein
MKGSQQRLLFMLLPVSSMAKKNSFGIIFKVQVPFDKVSFSLQSQAAMQQ